MSRWNRIRLRKRRMCAALLVALACGTVHAQDGVLDATFGANGRSYLYWGRSNPPYDYSTASAVQSDGAVVLVGNIGDFEFGCGNAPVSIGVARLRPDGHFDTAFGAAATPGQTVIHAGCNHQLSASAVRIDANGRILIVGTDAFLGMQTMTVWQLDANGAADATFGSGGKTQLVRSAALQPYDTADAFSVNALGDITVVGSTQDGGDRRNCAAFKMHSDGTLLLYGNTTDPSGARYLRTTVARSGVPATQCRLLSAAFFAPDFHFYETVAGGYYIDDLGVQRALTLGLSTAVSVSADWGDSNGVSAFNFDSYFNERRPSSIVALQPDLRHGRIWAAGNAAAHGADTRDLMALAALDLSGAFDTSVLSGAGYVLNDFSVGSRVGHAYASGLLVQHDGAIVLGGSFYWDGFANDAYLAALRIRPENGLPDASFGTFSTTLPGVAATQIPIAGASAETRATSLHFSAGENVVLGGYTHDYAVPGSYYYCAVRLVGDRIFADGFD